MIMSKESKILTEILKTFQFLECNILSKQAVMVNENFIKVCFKNSLNKNSIIRRILNEVVLSNDEIVKLLKIIYKKKD
jgi:hypothetical protein